MFKAVLATLMGALVFQTGVLAQIYVKSTGVGIGTATPTEKLHISGKTRIDASDNVLSFNSPNGAWQFLAFNKGGFRKAWAGLNAAADFHIRTEEGPGHIFLLPWAGRVIIESDQDNHNTGGALTLRHGGKTGVGEAMEWSIYNMKGVYGPSLQFWAYGDFGGRATLTLRDGGNVGIGTTNPQEKLQVVGTVKATTYMADVPPHWPDYVFDSTHQLPSLHKVENYIKQNHHLPEVPSAEDVKRDGLNIAINQATLLKKIEELTLYVIDQNKKQEEQNATQKAQNDKLQLLGDNQAMLLKKIEELTMYVIEQNKKILSLESKVKSLEEKGK